MISPLSTHSLMIGQRGLNSAQAIIQRATERLATGRRINRAADDPSGLVAVDELTTRIAAIEKKISAFNLEEARLGTKEGALSVVSDLLSELNGLVVSAANTGGLDQPEREGLQTQADSIIEALDLISNTATFQGQKLFDGLFSTSLGRTDATVRGEGEDSKTVSAVLASIRSGGVMNLLDGDLEAAQRSVEGATGSISTMRAAIGTRITQQIEHERNALASELENAQAARSDIRDADIATEMADLVRGQFLQQASISAILIARQAPQNALRLLAPNVALAKAA